MEDIKMELIRVRDTGYGVRYITEDCRYKIWQLEKGDGWRLFEIKTDGKLKMIKGFKYFKDAKNLLKEILKEQS